MCLKLFFLLVTLELTIGRKSMLIPIHCSDVCTISKVLCDISTEFMINQHLRFIISTHGEISSTTMETFNNFLLHINTTTLLEVENIEDTNQRYHLPRSMIIFTESLENLIDFEIRTRIYRMQDKAMPFFIYIAKATLGQFTEVLERIKELYLGASGFFVHGFFIVNEQDSVKLATVEWFSETVCNQAFLKVLNQFDKKSQTWIRKLENYEKFFDFFGCELVMLLPIPVDNVLRHVSGYAFVKNGTFSVHGITPKVFELAGTIYNFLPGYQPAIVPPSYINNYFMDEITFYAVNRTVKEPIVYFHVMSNYHWSNNVRVTNTFVDFKLFFAVTPTPTYTPYERLALPFDKETWILLCITLLSACVTILIINYCFKSIRTSVYGVEVRYPFLNLVQIIFGITLIKVPNTNFPRFIVILFIWFCLIFRTCFQSKSFEFMTSQPRHLMPETLADLLDEKYVIFAEDIGHREVRRSATDEHGRRY